MASGGWRPQGLLGDLLSEDLNDACCWACSGGGDVVCCDGCRAVYHLPCIGLKALPEDDWFCPLCHCTECGQSSRKHEAVSHINTKLIPVHNKPLQTRQSAQQRLPTGPGYSCPQQVRQWLQLQNSEPDEVVCATTEQQGPANATGRNAAAGEGEPQAKRQKPDPGSSSGSVSPGGSASGLVRCCCCQQACHVTCLPAALRQQYLIQTTAAEAPTPATTKATKGKQAAKGPQGSKQQQEQQQQVMFDPYFCSPSCQQVARDLAERCAQGLVQVDALADGTPVCWQLIQPAAVAAALLPPPEAAAAAVAAAFAGSPVQSPPKVDLTPCRNRSAAASGRGSGAGTSSDPAAAAAAVGLLGSGVAPGYTKQQALVLSQVLRDVQQLMQQQLGPAWEVRAFLDTLPWIISGLRCNTPGGLLDLSHFHVAVLWVGSTVSAAALLQVHGTALLEVSLAATLGELQHKQLGRLLISCVERFAQETCKVKHAWMPALGGVVKPCVGVSVLPSWDIPDGVKEYISLTPSSSLKLLGLSQNEQVSTAVASAAGASGGAAQEQQQQVANAQQQTPRDLMSCWALQLRYGPAPSVVDWLQLPKHNLLRYSYVPFVTKRLSPETLVPLPKFKKQQQRAGPASTGTPAPAAGAAAAGDGPAALGGTAGGPLGAGGSAGGGGVEGSAGHRQEHLGASLVQEAAGMHQTSQQHQQQVLIPAGQVLNVGHQMVVPGHLPAGGWWQEQQSAQALPLQPQLHQLPPRVTQKKAMQEQLQQQQLLVKQQLNSAGQLLPGMGTGCTEPMTVEARIAAGIAAYGCSASVVSGVNTRLNTQP